LTEFPGVVPAGGEGHVFIGAPGWPVHWPEGVQFWELARAAGIPKADSMAITTAETITAFPINQQHYCNTWIFI